MRIGLLPPSVLFALCVSCQSATLVLRTEPPEAEVRVRNANSGATRLIGKTPLTLDGTQLDDILSAGPALIELAKPSFRKTNVVIGGISGRQEVQVQLQNGSVEETRAINQIIQAVLEAERAIIENRLDEALRLAARIRDLNPNIAASYALEGSVRFIQGDFPGSKAAWMRVVDIEPSDLLATNTLAEIEKRMAGSAPSTQAPDATAAPTPPSTSGAPAVQPPAPGGAP